MHRQEQTELVDQARRGDPRAWETLYVAVYPRLRAYAATRAGFAAADDLVHETMTRAVASIGKFRWEAAGFEAWLFGIMRHVCLEHLRKVGRQRRQSFYHAVFDGAEPGEDLEMAEERQAVRDAFAQLAAKDQEVLALRLIAGLSIEEVSRALGKRSGAVRTAQSRALANLRRLMDAET